MSFHEQRHSAVLTVLEKFRISSVLDLGCGEGEFLRRLRHHSWVLKAIGIDACMNSLTKCIRACEVSCCDFLFQRDVTLEIQILFGSFLNKHSEMKAIESVVCIEVIEHIIPEDLPKLSSVVFGHIRPRVAVFTTPNKEYNQLFGMKDDQFRHPDHKFEWTRKEFELWCLQQSKLYNYSVKFEGIGPEHPQFGFLSQMATFFDPKKEEKIEQQNKINNVVVNNNNDNNKNDNNNNDNNNNDNDNNNQFEKLSQLAEIRYPVLIPPNQKITVEIVKGICSRIFKLITQEEEQIALFNSFHNKNECESCFKIFQSREWIPFSLLLKSEEIQRYCSNCISLYDLSDSLINEKNEKNEKSQKRKELSQVLMKCNRKCRCCRQCNGCCYFRLLKNDNNFAFTKNGRVLFQMLSEDDSWSFSVISGVIVVSCETINFRDFIENENFDESGGFVYEEEKDKNFNSTITNWDGFINPIFSDQINCPLSPLRLSPQIGNEWDNPYPY